MERTFKYSWSKLFKTCVKVLQDLKINIDYENDVDGIIQGVTKRSLRSWGEDIEIRLRKLENNKTEIIVNSKASAQLFSWGKDNENEEQIISSIKKALE